MKAFSEVAERFAAGVFLPLDDEEVVPVSFAAVDDQVGTESPAFISISSCREQLAEIPVPVIVKIDGQPALPEFWLQSSLEVDREAVHERHLVSVKFEQNTILHDDIGERSRHDCQEDSPVWNASACHGNIPTQEPVTSERQPTGDE